MTPTLRGCLGLTLCLAVLTGTARAQESAAELRGRALDPQGAAVAGDAVRLQAAYHPGADVLAAGGDMVKVWAYEAARFVPMAANKGGKPSLPGKELGTVKLGDFALGIGFSIDGSLLAMGKSSGVVEVWKVV